MTEIRTTITGLPEVVAHLQALPRVIADAQHAEIKALGDRYLAVLKAETPSSAMHAPGAQKIIYSYDNSEQTYTATSASYRIVNENPHLKYVLKGRGPIEAKHTTIIKSGPRRGAVVPGMLRFVVAGGRVIFRRKVGAAAPNAFDARAQQRMASDVAGLSGRIKARVIGGGA